MDWNWFLKVSRPVFDGFARLEPRKWGPIGTTLELAAETGKLARAITIFEGYRHGRKSRHEMADELSDIMFVLCRLVYDGNLQPGPEFIIFRAESVENAFFKIHLAIANLYTCLHESIDYPRAEVLKNVEEIAGLIIWLANHYDINLKEAHLDEMRLAATFQRLYFDERGQKKLGNKFTKLCRKVLWVRAVKLHEKKLNRL